MNDEIKRRRLIAEASRLIGKLETNLKHIINSIKAGNKKAA